MLNHTGQAGAPEKVVNDDRLHDAVSTKWHLTFKEIAKHLGIHRNTLRYKLRSMGLYHIFTQLPDGALDHILKIYKNTPQFWPALYYWISMMAWKKDTAP